MFIAFSCGFYNVLSDDALTINYVVDKMSDFCHSTFKGDLLPFLLAGSCLCDFRKEFGLTEIRMRSQWLMRVRVNEDGLFDFREMLDGFVEHIILNNYN